jgi:glucose-6-phosphate 1-dehydrogenase
MIERLVLLGATGDLTARYLLPGLVALRSGGHIGDGFSLVAVGREDWRDEEFRNWAGGQLDQHAGSFPRRPEMRSSRRLSTTGQTSPILPP